VTIEVDVLREDDAWAGIDLEGLAEAAVGHALAHFGIGAGEVAILACGDDRIAMLNARFRDRPRPTNVLSWPAGARAPAGEGEHPAAPDAAELGDVAIARETCVAEARAAGIPVADHVAHLIVHATLHLLGYDHVREGDAALMERLEIEILGKMGLPDPYTR
jgi:probable rRNA maturation factor